MARTSSTISRVALKVEMALAHVENRPLRLVDELSRLATKIKSLF